MKKGKLITSLCALILSLACLTFGVYSAVKTSFTASGTITFNAYGVECDVAIKVVGAEGGDKVLYATTNKTNAKRVAVETRDENAALGLVANYTADSTTVIGGSDTINLGELKFDELNMSKTEAERKTITMEVYVINYSGYAIEFQADSDGQNGDGSVTYKREMEELGIELDKYTTGAPTSNVGKNTTCAYKIVFTANSQSTSNNAFSVDFTIKPATGKTGAEATAYKYLTKNDFETVEKVADYDWDNYSEIKGKFVYCKKDVTNTKMIVPLIYCDANKNIVDETTDGAVLIEITQGGNSGDSDTGVIYKSQFANQTHLAFCEGYETVNQFSMNIEYGDDENGNYGAWRSSILKKVLLPNTLKNLGNAAFWFCENLTSITIPSSVTNIGASAFGSCYGLTSITIPSGVTSINNRTFDVCRGLTSIILPEGITSIGSSAFSGCSNLTSIILPEGITSIDSAAFSRCNSLTSITIPSSVISIGLRAFRECSSLTSITIPNNVTSIGWRVFEDCTNLSTAQFENATGWSVCTSVNGTYTTPSGLTPTTEMTTANATLLTSTYCSYYWKRG